MDLEIYFEERLEPQIAFYERNSEANKNYYNRFKVIEILMASLIILLAGMGSALLHSDLIIGFLAITVVLIATLDTVFKFKENWIVYRTAAEALRHEKYLYLTRVAPYNKEDSSGDFVQKTESLISTENSNLASHRKQMHMIDKQEI